MRVSESNLSKVVEMHIVKGRRPSEVNDVMNEVQDLVMNELANYIIQL